MQSVTIEELEIQTEPFIVDIRTEDDYKRGSLQNAINIPMAQLKERMAQLPKDKTIYLLCHTGERSVDYVEMLDDAGYDAVNISGGYRSFLRKQLSLMVQDEDLQTRTKEIERTIIKRYRKSIWRPFIKGIQEYDLIQENDKIAVCISGGKDSMLMAKLFQEIKRHRKFDFELVFLVMDPGYSSENRAIIEANARLMNIPITVFETNIFDSVYNVENNPCYLCARMRRGHLYNKAKELGCNKIALGHHFDDVIETILMSMIYGGQVETMMPKLHSANFPGMQLIRPMYFIREDEIKHWAKYNDLHFIQCACRFTDTCTTCNPDGAARSKRQEIKQLIAHLNEGNPQVVMNIFRSVENVKLNKIISYKKDGVIHSFLDGYDD